MKRFNANKKRNSLTMFASFVVITIVLITIGYSALQNTGIVSDITAKVRPEFNIRITDIQIENTSDAIVISKDYNNTGVNGVYKGKVFSEVTFTKTTSSVTYKIEILNIGNVEMGIASITGLPSNLAYELDTNYYDIGEKICDRTITTQCTGGARKTIYVTIKYKSGSGTNTSTNLSANFDLNFKEIHNVYYNNAAIDYVIDGGNKTVSLGANPPTYVRVNGTVSNSSYSSPNVTLTGVTSDITIEEIHKIYVGNVEQSVVAVHGGNATVNLGNSAPSSVGDITITGSYTSRTYSSPNLTINVITSDIYITISSGQGGGTWSDPIEDNTVSVYDPDNMTIPANSTIVYEGVLGEPQITTDANGDITHFKYMNIDQSTGISSPSGGLDTGVLAFDGTDFEVTLKGQFVYDTKSLNPVIVMSSKVNGSTQGVVLFNSKNKQKYTKLDGSTNVTSKTDIDRFRTIRYNNGTIADYYNLTRLNQTSENYTIGYVSSDAPVTVTLKMYCQSNKVTAELYNSSGTKVGVLPGNFQYDFTGVNLSGITIELGHWVNNSDTVYDYTFTILEFEVKKIN